MHPESIRYHMTDRAIAQRQLARNIDMDYDEERIGEKITLFEQNILEIRKGASADDIPGLWARLEAYMGLCRRYNMRPSNMNMYMAVGLSKQQIDAWADGQTHKAEPEYREFARACREICAATLDQLALENKVNQIWAIWRDKTFNNIYERPNAPENTEIKMVEEVSTPDELVEKYKDLPLD